MDEADRTKINSLKEAIELIDPQAVTQLPFDLFERRGNRTTKLIITSNEATPVGGKRRWFDFELSELTLVTNLTVELSGYSDYSDFDVRWINEKDEILSVSVHPSGDSIRVPINDLCKSISFRPPTVLFFSTYVNRVILEGIERQNLSKALGSLAQIEVYSEEISSKIDQALTRANSVIAESAKLSAERTVVARDLGQQKSSLARTKKAIEESALKRAELIAQNGAAETALTQAGAKLRELQAQSEELEKQRDTLRADITEADSELRSLRSNINIFPSEIVGFANQARRTGWQYFALAALPILVMTTMFVLLIKGAADLTTVLDDHPNSKITDIMISRVPYVTIAVAVITACYKLSRAFFMELIKINTQRLNLTKISIVARDVSAASEQGLNLTDEDIYKLRTELKMEMLRDHLKEYLSKDFKFTLPNRILGMAPWGEKSSDIQVESAAPSKEI